MRRWVIGMVVAAATSSPASAWQQSQQVETRYQTTAYSPGVQLSVVCRISPTPDGVIGRASVEMSVQDGPLRREGDLRAMLSVGQQAEPVPVTLYYVGRSSTVYHYAAPSLTREAFEALRRFASEASYGAAAKLALEDGTEVTFPVNPRDTGAPIDTWARCSQASLRALERARILTDVRSLITLERTANGICRGTPGGDDGACDEREVYGERLGQLGWCYGHGNQVMADRRWERCRR